MLEVNEWYIVHNKADQCKVFIDKMQAQYGNFENKLPEHLDVAMVKAEIKGDDIYFRFWDNANIRKALNKTAAMNEYFYTNSKDGLLYHAYDNKRVNDFEKTREWQEYLDEQKILDDVIKNSQPVGETKLDNATLYEYATKLYENTTYGSGIKENNMETREQQLEGVRNILDKWLETQRKSADKILQSKTEEIIKEDPAYRTIKQFCNLVNTTRKANDQYYIETTIEELIDKYNLLSMETKQKLVDARKKREKYVDECRADSRLAFNFCQIADSGEAMMEILQKQGIIGE